MPPTHETLTTGLDIIDLYDDIAGWSQATHGLDAERGPLGPLKHLVKEAVEAQSNPGDAIEYADCLIVLLDAVRRAGISLKQLLTAAHFKMKANKKRTWPKPVKDEPCEHVRPKVVCLCGSTRFVEAFRQANFEETLAGRIVLSVGSYMHSDDELWPDEEERQKVKVRLDELHKRKIDLADEVLVLNVGGYIGESTRSEVAYALALGKKLRYLEPIEDIEEG